MKNKIKLLFSFSLTLFLFNSSILAQQEENSIFYLKNGSIYIGKVLNDETDSIQVRLIDGNDIQISEFAVKRYLAAKDIKVFPDGRYNPIRGFFFHTGLGFNGESLGKDEDERISSHVPYLFGWHFNSRWSAASGLGFEFNEARISGFRVTTQVTSLFLYGRYNLTEQKRRPFLYARVGSGFASEQGEDVNEDQGGFQFASRKKSRWVLSLGYHFQQVSGQQRFLDFAGGEVIVDYDLSIRRIILSVGVEFNRRPKRYRRQ